MKHISVALTLSLNALIFIFCGWFTSCKKEVAPTFVPFTLTTNDLPILEYEPFNVNETIINYDIRYATSWVIPVDSKIPSDTMKFASDDTLYYFQLPISAKGKSYKIIRQNSVTSQRYYLSTEQEGNLLFREISPISLDQYENKENRIFRISLSKDGEYYVDVSAIYSRPRYFRREATDDEESSNRKRDTYKDELIPTPIFKNSPKQNLIFSTKYLEKTEYITLDSLWHLRRLKLYENNYHDFSFHLLPEHYKNHDILIEHTILPDSRKERYLLRYLQLQRDAQRRTSWEIDPNPILDLTPQQYDDFTEETVYRTFEIFEENIILVYEERFREGVKHKLIYSMVPMPDPDNHSDKKYMFSQNNYMFLSGSSGDAHYHDMEEASVVKNYLIWYGKKHDEIWKLNMLLETGKDREYYQVNMEAYNELAKILRTSGFVSEKYITQWHNYFKEADAYYTENHIGADASEYFNYDIFLNSIEINAAEDLLNEYITITKVSRISPDRTVVTACFDFDHTELTFELSLHDGKWLIDSQNTDTGIYTPAQQPLVILFMTDAEKQQAHMINFNKMGYEDRLYFLIETAIYEFRTNGISVDIIDPCKYHHVNFGDNIIIDIDDFKPSDMLLYVPGKAPLYINNIYGDKIWWQDISTYFDIKMNIRSFYLY